MWSDEIYLVPIAGILSMYKLEEDVHLEGNLSDEFSKLMAKYLPSKSIRILVDSSVAMYINCDYLKGRELSFILLDVVRRFSLFTEINAMSDSIITVTLKEKKNGCLDSESKI